MSIVVVVTIMVAVMMPPLPVLFLLFFAEMAVIAVWIAVGFDCPLVVIHDLVVVPSMIVVVVRIVGAVVMLGAARKSERQDECQRQQECIRPARSSDHEVESLRVIRLQASGSLQNEAQSLPWKWVA